jgi:hypothetical protein
MLVPKRVLFSSVLAVGAAGALLFSVGASAGEGSRLLSATLAPSLPTDPAFHGVTAGGAPWVLNRGEVSIRDNGKFELEVDGLVIPALGTPDGVKTISASLYCGADANAVPTATTKQVPLSSEGDATIRETLTLPATCLAPIVLVNPNGIAKRYISVSGWRN